MAGVNTKNPGLPRGRPSHHWGKVVKPPSFAKPIFGAPPPGASIQPAIAGADPGSVADVLNQLQAILQQTVTRNLNLYLPDFYPIPTAQAFQYGGTTTTSGAGTVTQIPGSSFQLPGGYIGVIASLNISVLTTLTTATNQQYTIRFNGVPAPGWSQRTFAGRGAQNFERFFDAALRIPRGAVVDIVNINVDGGTYTVGADITGWYMSVADCLRWIQGKGQLLAST